MEFPDLVSFVGWAESHEWIILKCQDHSKLKYNYAMTPQGKLFRFTSWEGKLTGGEEVHTW